MTDSEAHRPTIYRDPRLDAFVREHAATCGGSCVRLVAAPDGSLYEGVSFAWPLLAEWARAQDVTAASVKAEPVPVVGVPERLEAFPIDMVEAPVRVDAGRAISWDAYLRVEGALDEILSRSDERPGRCLVAGHVWLGILARLLRGAPKRAPHASTESVDRAVRFYVDRTRSEDYARTFQVASKPAAQGALKRMALATITTVRRAAEGRRRFWLPLVPRVLVTNAVAWAGRGGLRPPGMEEVLAWARLEARRDVVRSEPAGVLLRLWLRHAVHRKDLVRRSDVFSGYGYLLLAWGLVEAGASARAEAGADDPVAEALGAVEALYLCHPDLDQAFLHHPAAGLQMERLMRRPNFAHSIVDV